MSSIHQSTRGKRMEGPSFGHIDIQVLQPHQNCLLFQWDREQGCLRATGIASAQPGLPADRAILRLEGQMDIPVLLLTPASAPPGTRMPVRLLGGLCASPVERALPAHGWFFVAVAQIDSFLVECQSLEHLPTQQLEALKAYVQQQTHETQQGEKPMGGEVLSYPAEMVAQFLRETRFVFKREQRMHAKERRQHRLDHEEKPVAWRAIEGLSTAERRVLEHLTAPDPSLPYAQAEQLLRFVHPRFQQALSDLLLDDERLLAFIERPLLQHRTGALRLHTWRSNEGLFVVTDRQILWVRDFLSPSGANPIPGGYMARSIPLERLRTVVLLPAGRTPSELADHVEEHDSPYLRLVMKAACREGSDYMVVEFPARAGEEKALAHIIGMLNAFLPLSDGRTDRRVRRLSEVERWQPSGAQADHLTRLEGQVPSDVAERLKQQLTQLLQPRAEEALVVALIPALEDYHSPTRLIALTRRALIVIDAQRRTKRLPRGALSAPQERVSRYELAAISSVQLRSSLMGSSLSIFLPQRDGSTLKVMFPFHSPALAWFIPLFTRLRLALGDPSPDSLRDHVSFP